MVAKIGFSIAEMIGRRGDRLAQAFRTVSDPRDRFISPSNDPIDCQWFSFRRVVFLVEIPRNGDGTTKAGNGGNARGEIGEREKRRDEDDDDNDDEGEGERKIINKIKYQENTQPGIRVM